jgi:hypothetical protein
MGFEDLFLHDILPDFDFSLDAKNLILRVFDIASNALDDEWKKYLEAYEREISDDADESVIGIAFSERDWEERLFWQRRQAVGVLALDWLKSSFQSALHQTKRYLDKSHPPNPKGYKTKGGWLAEVSKEYRERFKIDFTLEPSFDRIEELVLARNAGIHRDEGNPLKRYLAQAAKAKIEPRFIDVDENGEDQFFVTRDALISVIKDCEAFLKWVVSEVKRLRPVEPKAGV